jgi:hypothetical protein
MISKKSHNRALLSWNLIAEATLEVYLVCSTL